MRFPVKNCPNKVVSRKEYFSVHRLAELQKICLRRAWNVGGKHWFPSKGRCAGRGQNFLAPHGRTYGPLPLPTACGTQQIKIVILQGSLISSILCQSAPAFLGQYGL